MLNLGTREAVEPMCSPIDELILDGLQAGQAIQFRTTSGSMHPTLKIGAAFLVKRAPIEAGDIVLANVAGKFRAHRLIAIIDARAEIRGDANSESEWVIATNVVGKVVEIHDDWIALAHRIGGRLKPILPKWIWRLAQSAVRRGPGTSWGLAE